MVHSEGLKISAQVSRARIRPATVRSAILRRKALSLEKALSIGLLGNAAEVVPSLLNRGAPIDVVTDQTAAHDVLTGYVPVGMSLEGADELRQSDPEQYEKRALESIAPLEDHLPASLRERLKLVDLWGAIRALHFPGPESDLRMLNGFRTPAHWRLIFEEFFWLECGLSLKRSKARLQPGIAFELNDRVRDKIKAMLPFKPTGAQKRVLGEIARDMQEPHPMSRLLQGDVGSGKTVVCGICQLDGLSIILECNYDRNGTKDLFSKGPGVLRNILQNGRSIVSPMEGSSFNQFGSRLNGLLND